MGVNQRSAVVLGSSAVVKVTLRFDFSAWRENRHEIDHDLADGPQGFVIGAAPTQGILLLALVASIVHVHHVYHDGLLVGALIVGGWPTVRRVAQCLKRSHAILPWLTRSVDDVRNDSVNPLHFAITLMKMFQNASAK